MNRTGRPGEWPDFRALLKRHGIRPDKRLAQHFLFDPAALDRVVGCAELSGNETILEVGAGVGSLTLRLAAAAGKVIAVEVDRRLLPALREAIGDRPNIEVIAGDILALDLPRPRSVTAGRFGPRFQDLYDRLWDDLRYEVVAAG